LFEIFESFQISAVQKFTNHFPIPFSNLTQPADLAWHFLLPTKVAQQQPTGLWPPMPIREQLFYTFHMQKRNPQKSLSPLTAALLAFDPSGHSA
jgi:hypothetical protein